MVLAVGLVPWTIYLGISLPRRHLSVHWDVSWTGLDAALIVSLLATGLLAYVKSIWIVIAASITGSLLLVDAWFDIMSERAASQFAEAFFMGVLIELPLAILSFYVAVHALRKNTKLPARRK